MLLHMIDRVFPQTLYIQQRQGFSTYAPNSIESLWAVSDQLELKPTEELTIEEVFDQCENAFRLWHQEKRWLTARPRPSGRYHFQPNLMRGVGIWVNKGPCVDQGFRRATVEWLESQDFSVIAHQTGVHIRTIRGQGSSRTDLVRPGWGGEPG